MASNNIDMSTTGKKGEARTTTYGKVHGTLENQPTYMVAFDSARRQNRFLHEQASSSLDGVIPMHYKTIDNTTKK